MKKTIPLLFIILLFIFSSFCFALNSSIWYKFPIPEYSYSHAYLSSGRILDWVLHGKNSELNVGGAVVYDLFCQKEKSTVYYNGVISGVWNRVEREHNNETYKTDRKSLKNSNRFGATRYFDLINVWGNGKFDIIAQNEGECSNELQLEVGAGLGRIIRCTSVNKAIQLLQEFDIRLDEKLILGVADLIDKISVYKKQYRDTWQEVFYQEIAEMIEKPEQGLKVRRILTSIIYVTFSRSRGWEVKIGYMNSFFYLADQPRGYVTIQAEYVLPWGLNKQINLGTRCNRKLDDESYSIYINAEFDIEHKYTWGSYIRLFASKEFNTNGERGNADYGVRIGSKKNIFDKLVSSLILDIYKSSYSSDPYFNLSLVLKYYLW
ncbi:MAG: hypothetical protein J7M10_00635 [Candidatus Cloacimonetes bacterium]|nr:hypothetical protein [Candidatus Cloacimonadota bacterium]